MIRTSSTLDSVIKMKLLKFKGEFGYVKCIKYVIRVYLYRNTVLSNHNLPDCDDFFEGLKLSFVTDYLTYKTELTSCIRKNGYFVKESVMTFKSISSYQMVYNLYSIFYTVYHTCMLIVIGETSGSARIETESARICQSGRGIKMANIT